MPVQKKNLPAKKSKPDQSLRKHLVALLRGGEAHIQFADALTDFPSDKRGAFAVLTDERGKQETYATKQAGTRRLS